MPESPRGTWKRSIEKAEVFLAPNIAFSRRTHERPATAFHTKWRLWGRSVCGSRFLYGKRTYQEFDSSNEAVASSRKRPPANVNASTLNS
jgi:hypothetical protein